MKNHGLTFIKKVNLLPSEVTHLVIARPKKFKFKAGDYIKIKIPVICSTEYHPFTISSAPENEDEIWLHIRKSGDWTKKLYNYFKTISARQNSVKPLTYWSRYCSFIEVRSILYFN
jgi:predicted ferric reductase